MKFAFLICSERSGSNFIVSLMNGHPEISGPPSSHLFRLFGLNAHNYYPTSHAENWQAFVDDLTTARANMLSEWETEISAAELISACPNQTIRAALDYIYTKECRADERLSFVKENYTYLVSNFLLANWPDAHFVYMVRDPRDVAASLVKMGTFGGVKQAAEFWQRDQQKSVIAFRQIQSAGRALQIRYEDLVSDTPAIAKRLCEHVGVDYDPVMLEYYKDKRTLKNAGRNHAWGNIAKPVMTGNFGKYKKTLSPADIRYVELMCFEHMQTFGYELDTDAADLSAEDRRKALAELEHKLTKGAAEKQIPAAEQIIRDNRLALIERVKNRVPAS